MSFLQDFISSELKVSRKHPSDLSLRGRKFYSLLSSFKNSQNVTVLGAAVKDENVAVASLRYRTSVLSSVSEYMLLRLGL